jgi:N-acetylmuramoyl-L-alanine amidase
LILTTDAKTNRVKFSTLRKENYSMKIAVDPGHGMSNASANVFDPGAVTTAGGVTFAEADIALRYGLSLNFLLQQKGIATFMTRTSSADAAPVGTRASRAEAANCTHFVSLHLNSAGPTAKGVEVLYRHDANEDLAADMSHRLAGASGIKDRGAKKRTDLAVLRFDAGPSVLVELGFITNKNDRDILLSGRPMRVAICKAIMEALGINTSGL